MSLSRVGVREIVTIGAAGSATGSALQERPPLNPRPTGLPSEPSPKGAACLVDEAPPSFPHCLPDSLRKSRGELLEEVTHGSLTRTSRHKSLQSTSLPDRDLSAVDEVMQEAMPEHVSGFEDRDAAHPLSSVEEPGCKIRSHLLHRTECDRRVTVECDPLQVKPVVGQQAQIETMRPVAR